MSLEQLLELNTESIDSEFGFYLVEEINETDNLEALSSLAALISVRVLELTSDPKRHAA